MKPVGGYIKGKKNPDAKSDRLIKKLQERKISTVSK